ncbi:MAG: hypothetical protein CML56_01240 [Rhodobacteraceae bacterium]|nr:hypothetical protein [Paracoccaceae bacterium]
MDIKTFQNVAHRLPAEMAILMRGPTGVGKSFLGKAIAEGEGKPFIDVRLSVMSEGDVAGYPDLEGMKKNGIMTMCMPSWFMRAVKEPVVLMLDEMNRALPGVQQSAFQLVLDRELGNDEDGVPYKLHPETRIIAAVNHGAEYDVNDMDPALLRRFWVCDIEPTSADWIEWANENGIDSVMIDFIRQNPAHLRVDPTQVEPGTVAPNPASWHRLDTSLAHMQMAPSTVCGQQNPGFFAIASGFVGTEAAIALTDFVEKYELVITAEDILDNYKDVEDRIAAQTASGLAHVIEKLSTHCKDNEWSAKQAKNVAAFAESLSGELLVQMWNSVSNTQNLPNIQKIHKLIGQRVVKAVQESRSIS